MENMENQVPSFMDRVKSDDKTTRGCFYIVLGLCLLTFICSYRHIYNVLTGPHAVESVNVMKPGIKRNVIVDGPLRSFGTRETTREWKGIELGSGSTSGAYYLSATSNASFLVYSYGGKELKPPVTGRLKRFSKEEAATLPKSDRLSHWYVDAGRGKWYDTSLFMWAAVPVFFLSLPFFIMGFFKKPTEHAAIKKLGEWGDSDTLIREIDADMNRHPQQVTKQSFFSKDWAILFWGMEILRPQDIRSSSLVYDKAKNKYILKVVFHLVDGKDHNWEIKRNKEATKILDTLLKTYPDKCTPQMKTLAERLKEPG